MYKEKNLRKAHFFVVVLSFLAAALFLYFVLGVLPIIQLVKDIVLMAALVGFVFVFIKRWMCVYEYEITGEEIILRTYLGSTLRTEITGKVDTIKCFCAANDLELRKYKGEKIKMFATGDQRHTVVFEADGKFTKVEFAPSEQMIEMIKNTVSGRSKN